MYVYSSKFAIIPFQTSQCYCAKTMYILEKKKEAKQIHNIYRGAVLFVFEHVLKSAQ